MTKIPPAPAAQKKPRPKPAAKTQVFWAFTYEMHGCIQAWSEGSLPSARVMHRHHKRFGRAVGPIVEVPLPLPAQPKRKKKL